MSNDGLVRKNANILPTQPIQSPQGNQYWPGDEGGEMDGAPVPGYGYAAGYHLNGLPAPTAVAAYLQGKQNGTAAKPAAPGATAGSSNQTYPLFQPNQQCRPSPPSNGDPKEAEYEKFINWFLNAQIGKPWVLIEFSLIDTRKITGSVINIVNLSYRSNPKPSEMGVEIVLNEKLYRGIVCVPITNIQIEKALIANSQYQW